jgi:hypothetical protein
MTISLNGRLDEQVVMIQAAANDVLTTTVGDCKYVSLKNHRKVQVVIDILNATTVTGTAVTLKQATAVAATGEKALSFTRMLANSDVAASQTMVETAVASDTFTTATTNSKRLRYVIDVDSSSLDVANGFDCFRVDCTAMSAALGTVTYILYGARYSGITAAIAILD